MKRLGIFLLSLDGLLVHRRSPPSNFVRFLQQITGTHLYSSVERGTVREKCLAQEHITVSQARARTRTARSGNKRTNHEATAPPTDWLIVLCLCLCLCLCQHVLTGHYSEISISIGFHKFMLMLMLMWWPSSLAHKLLLCLCLCLCLCLRRK